ncbi:hypothetical protein ACFL6L_02875 [candidate division KSB1 bacterium]
MKFKDLSLCFCLFVLCTALLAYSGDASAQKSFQPGVKLMVDGKPINVTQGHSVPAVFDWNNDGKKDIITGQFRDGKISLYLNRGTDAQPVFKDFEYMKAGGKEISLPSG